MQTPPPWRGFCVRSPAAGHVPQAGERQDFFLIRDRIYVPKTDPTRDGTRRALSWWRFGLSCMGRGNRILDGRNLAKHCADLGEARLRTLKDQPSISVKMASG